MAKILQSVLRWKNPVEQWAGEIGISPSVIYAFIHQESGGNPAAKRFEPGYMAKYQNTPKFQSIIKATKLPAEEIASSYGLMQLMLPLAWGYMGDSQKKNAIYVLDILCDPYQNVRFGTAHIGALFKHCPDFSDKSLAVVAGAYNGAGTASSYARNIVALNAAYKLAI